MKSLLNAKLAKPAAFCTHLQGSVVARRSFNLTRPFQTPSFVRAKIAVSLFGVSAASGCNQVRSLRTKASLPEPGEIHVIVGPMFAGKTTTLLERIKAESGNGRFAQFLFLYCFFVNSRSSIHSLPCFWSQLYYIMLPEKKCSRLFYLHICFLHLTAEIYLLLTIS